MANHVLMGAFDSERFLRDDNLSRLPAISDPQAQNIISAMDSLLFPFCQNGDFLVTRFPMGDHLLEYLGELGFGFTNKSPGFTEGKASETIYELVLREADSFGRGWLSPDIVFTPYCIIPQAIAMCRGLNIKYEGPPIEAVRKVNSKIYSKMLDQAINPKSYGVIVDSHGGLLTEGQKYLKTTAFLVKDPYGVSGKGNILIHSEAILKRIVSFVAAQEEKGSVTALVLEPLLRKQSDFSCEFVIDREGRHKVLCIQTMLNQGFAYQGSLSAEPGFTNFLEEKGYFEFITRVAGALFNEGYYGEVCVDSMVLEDNEIVPLVEINARKSMGFINHRLDCFLQDEGFRSNLTHFSVGHAGQARFESILAEMGTRKILFKRNSAQGIIPLSDTALLANLKPTEKRERNEISKGRFYMAVVGQGPEERRELTEAMRGLLLSLDFRIF